MILHVLCPVCDEAEVDLKVTVDPGEPMVMYYRDGSGHPGSPAGIQEIVSSEYNCLCRGNLANMFQHSEPAQKQVLAVYDESVYELANEMFPEAFEKES